MYRAVNEINVRIHAMYDKINKNHHFIKLFINDRLLTIANWVSLVLVIITLVLRPCSKPGNSACMLAVPHFCSTFALMPFSVLTMLAFLEPTLTWVLVSTPTGNRAYSHRAMTKLPRAQAQTSTAIEDDTSSAGTKKRRATPIQNNEKTMATPRAKTMVQIPNVIKASIGKNVKSTCTAAKDCASGS